MIRMMLGLFAMVAVSGADDSVPIAELVMYMIPGLAMFVWGSLHVIATQDL